MSGTRGAATRDAATARWRDWSCAVTVTVADGRRVEEAAGVVRALMAEVEQAASRFRADSDLERINDAAGRLVLVRPLTLRLVETAVRAARLTGGAVDPTLGGRLVGLGYDADIADVRRREAAAARPACESTATGAPGSVSGWRAGRWRAVALDRTLGRVGVPAGVRLDLGATAKAWTADEAARRVHRRLGDAVLVGIGGDLAAAGEREWRVDVAETEGTPSVRVGLAHGGLATSSSLGRRWHGPDGVQRHHVLDPRTGRPAEDRWRTATVWAPTALAANVVSTWALVDGDAAGRHLADRGLAARLVGRDGRVELVGGWPADRAVA